MLKRITSSRFVRNIAVLATGHAAAQALTLAASPVLTRLFDPTAFGTFGLLIAVSTVIVPVSGLRYELAVVSAKDDSTAANLLALSCCVVLLIFLLSVAIIGSGEPWILSQFERPDLAGLLWWLPALILAGGTSQVLNHWLIRITHYKRVATLRFIQALTVVSGQVTAGLASAGPTGLIGARTLGSFVLSSALTYSIWRSHSALLKSEISLSRMWRLAREFSRFPKYNASQNLVSTLSRSAIPFLLAFFFGIESVGLYWLADRVLRAPTSLVERSTRTVFYQRASEMHNKGESFYRLLISTSGVLFLLGLVPLMVLLFFGPELFAFVFGDDWRRAGVFTQWLAAWWLVAFVSGPAVESLTVLGLQKYSLLFQIVLSVCRVLSIIVAAYIGDDLTAIAACSIVGVVLNLALVFAVLIVVPQRIGLKGQVSSS